MRIQKLYVDNGKATVIDPITGEMVEAEMGHYHYGTDNGREAVSEGMWMSHKTNCGERGVDSHLTPKERKRRQVRDYFRFWTVNTKEVAGNITLSTRLNRKTGNKIVKKYTKYTNEEGHSCILHETWTENTKPFSGVLTVNGLDVLSGWEVK